MKEKITFHLARIFWNSSIIHFLFRYKFFIVVYYTFFSRVFHREMHSLGYGLMSYHRDLKTSNTNLYLLRRNTHRLEKGLLMRPRRPVFALGYIQETMNAYVFMCKKTAQGENEHLDTVKWAHDVLTAYFNAVPAEKNELVDQLRKRFEATEYSESISDESFSPYLRKDQKLADITPDQFYQLCQQRRSVRWYQDKVVPRGLIDQAIMSASLSPSACNRQPFRFQIFDDPGLVQEISALPMGTKGFNHNFPAIVAVIGDQSAYYNERDRHVIYIDGSLASMTFMLSLETLGLSSCPINWPDVEHLESKLTRKLNLSPEERTIMFISVGYPDPEGMIAFSQKKNLDQIRKYN